MRDMELRLTGIKGDLELHQAETSTSFARFNLDRESAELEVRGLGAEIYDITANCLINFGSCFLGSCTEGYVQECKQGLM